MCRGHDSKTVDPKIQSGGGFGFPCVLVFPGKQGIIRENLAREAPLSIGGLARKPLFSAAYLESCSSARRKKADGNREFSGV
jgi:hypothetical protein